MIGLNNIYERLPTDLFAYILEFVVIITPSVEAFRQNKRNKINRLIKMAISRNLSSYNDDLGDYFVLEDDDGDHWIFGFNIDSGESLQLQACNCKKCGNYSYPLSFEVPNHIMCSCV